MAPEPSKAPAPATATPPPAEGRRGITPNQQARVAELSDDREISPERLTLVCQILTRRPVEELTSSEASGLLQMLGAPPLSSRRGFARQTG